jgi:hypothetical protein
MKLAPLKALPGCTLLGLCVLSVNAPAAEPWSTYRGNSERTGNTDGKPGPAAPKVLWAHKSQEHFIASPVPSGGRLYVSGLGALNTASFHGARPGFHSETPRPEVEGATGEVRRGKEER